MNQKVEEKVETSEFCLLQTCQEIELSSVWGKGVNFLAFHVPHMEPTRQCQVKPSNKECSVDLRS